MYQNVSKHRSACFGPFSAIHVGHYQRQEPQERHLMGLQDQKPHLMLWQGFIDESKLKNSLKWRLHNQS